MTAHNVNVFILRLLFVAVPCIEKTKIADFVKKESCQVTQWVNKPSNSWILQISRETGVKQKKLPVKRTALFWWFDRFFLPQFALKSRNCWLLDKIHRLSSFRSGPVCPLNVEYPHIHMKLVMTISSWEARRMAKVLWGDDGQWYLVLKQTSTYDYVTNEESIGDGPWWVHRSGTSTTTVGKIHCIMHYSMWPCKCAQ